GATSAALIEENDAVFLRIEEATILRTATSPWSAMYKGNGNALRSAALFNVQAMEFVNLDVTAAVRLDVWVENQHGEGFRPGEPRAFHTRSAGKRYARYGC